MRTHRIRILTGVLALVAVGMVLMPSTSEATTPRRYTATSAPANIIGGVPTPVTVTVTNTTSTDRNRDDRDEHSERSGLSIGAARVVVPIGMRVTGPINLVYRTADGVRPLPEGTRVRFNVTERRIEVTNTKVMPGASLDITVTVDACPAGSYAWATDTRQSNEFHGSENKFVRVGVDPVTTIRPQDACRLAFTGQPTNTFPGTIITTTPYGGAPSTPVAVTAVAGNGAPLTWWSTAITVTVAGGDPAATLSGGGAAGPVNGTASYTPSLDKKSNTPYTLNATSPGLVAGTSNGFIVKFGASVECTEAQPCSTPPVPGPNGGTAQATVDQNVSGTLATEWDPEGEPAPDCAGYEEMPSTVFFNLSGGTGSFAGLTKTVTLVAPIPAGSTSKDEAWEHQVCFRAPYAFPGFEIADLLHVVTDADFVHTTAHQVAGAGTTATDDDRWQALLFTCSLVPSPEPCVISRTVTIAPTANTPGSVTIVLRVPAGDPWAR